MIPRAVEVTVKAGDNRGQTVVQQECGAGNGAGWDAGAARPQAYRLPAAADDGLKTVVIVQAPRGGRVLGVAQREVLSRSVVQT